MQPMSVIFFSFFSLTFCACSPAYYTGSVDLHRAAQGEVFIEFMDLGNQRAMIRAVGVIEAPPWRVWNAIIDVEGLPLWHPSIVSAYIRAQDGERFEADVTLRPSKLMRPVTTSLEFIIDHQRRHVNSRLSDNDFFSSAQTVVKIEDFHDGQHTLLHMYSTADLKISTVLDQAKAHADATVESLHNLRRTVELPRYAEQQEHGAPKVQRAKAVLPGFRAHHVEDDLLRDVERVFAAAFSRNGTWTVITRDEMVALLDYQGQRQLTGCAATPDCTVDIGKALATEHLLHGDLSRSAGRLVLSATLVSIHGGTVEGRATVDAADAAELLAKVRQAAAELAATRPVHHALETSKENPPFEQ